MVDPNLWQLEVVADRLGETLRNELVFLGGAIAGLLVDDPAAPDIRPTEDVDTTCRVSSQMEFHRIEAALRDRGFAQDMTPGTPICRWRSRQDDTEVLLDVMPSSEQVLGFTNRWYPLVIDTAVKRLLPSGVQIRLVSAPAFVATKLEAFANRGRGDFLASHDLEDLLAVVDGRSSLLEECRVCPRELREWLATTLGGLLAQPAFLEALPGHLPSDRASQARLPDLRGKLLQIANL